MAKTQEELTQLKTEYETLNNKLKELTEDELKMVIGGEGPNYNLPPIPPDPRRDNRNNFPSVKYRCLNCGHEYIAHVVAVTGEGYYGNESGCCPECGSINIENLGYL